MRAVKPLYLKAILLTFGASLWLMLSACGTNPQDALVVAVQLPAEANPETFWFGLDRRELTIEGEGDPRTVAWSQGGTAEVSAKAGEKITLTAYNSANQVIVRGEARVGKQKRVTIPVSQTYD
jgi:hypothetical protein